MSESEPEDLATAVRQALEGGAALSDLWLLLHPTTAANSPWTEIEARCLGVQNVRVNVAIPRGKGMIVDCGSLRRQLAARP